MNERDKEIVTCSLCRVPVRRADIALPHRCPDSRCPLNKEARREQ